MTGASATVDPAVATRAFAIDVHAHIVVPELYELTKAHSLFAQSEYDPALSAEQKAGILARNNDVVRRMADVTQRIAAMDRMRVAVQVLSASLVHQGTHWAEPAESLAIERRNNDAVAAMVKAAPTRFVGLGGVPLQDPVMAAEELERCVVALGLKGVGISTRVGDKEIGHTSLRPFWAKAEALDAVVYIHPAGNPDSRFTPYTMWNSLGQSMEETFAIASLFYDGILDAYPALRICVSHGGGYMPFYTGRIDRNYAEKPVTRRNMSKPPADYLRMLHYDTCVYDPIVLRNLVEKVGIDRVMLGSDYPIGELQPVETIEGAEFLSDAQKSAILVGNASRLYGINLAAPPASTKAR